jgi:1-acyl-sn-glycerol-3-phosphate acyltransferase
MTWLRSAVFNAFFYLVTFLLCLWGIVLWRTAPHRLMALIQWWARLMCAALRLICGIKLVVIGRENIPAGGAALIASQHQGAFDTFVWLALLPRPTYVVKQELLRIPVFGALLRPAGMIVVDRSAGGAAIRQLLRDTSRAVAEQRQVVIFPEGTRTAFGADAPLHPGVAAMAAHSHLQVVPVATDSGRRWGRRSFCKRAGPIHLVIGPPLPADLRRDALLTRLRAAWQEAAARLQPVDNSVS